MHYAIIAGLLLVALFFLTRSAKAEYDKYLAEEEKIAPILDATEELSTLRRNHDVMDVKEKVVESSISLTERERTLAETVAPEVEVVEAEETKNV